MNMPPGSMSGGGGKDSPSGMTMMHMSLYWGKEAVILFPGWPEQSLGMYILALFFVFFLAMAIELLSILPTFRPSVGKVMVAFTQATVYGLRMALAYLIMLAVMSFNIGILIVAVVGHAFGFFIVKCRSPAAADDGAQGMPSGCITSNKV